ncbi:MAG TPA: sugar-binding protein [Bacteroidales bacterium]|nr:sugar-binding protein [Bacteroidales bacterium]
MLLFRLFLAVLLVTAVHSLTGKVVSIPYCCPVIKIDGNQKEWKCCYRGVFSDTLGHLRTAPGRTMMAFFDDSYDYSKIWLPLSRNQVEILMCWDMNNIYFFFRVEDQHLFAEIEAKGETPYIHMNDGIEIYIDAKADSDTMMDINDYQFLFDAVGNSLVFRGDREVLESDTVVVPKSSGQNLYFEYIVHSDGTFNDSCSDKGFTAEIAIPFAAIGLKPSSGLKLKLDMCCNDGDYSFQSAENYDDTSLRYWPFNWVGISDFGYPETWLEVQLTGAPGWWDKMSDAKMRQWFIGYLTALVLTLLVIITLILRMRKIIRLLARQDIPFPKVVILEKQPSQTNTQELPANEMILKKAADYISENPAENIHSEKLAKQLGITIRKLQRVTREELQTTPTKR